MDDFKKYEELRDGGAPPREVYGLAKSDGLDPITSIRLLRKVFGLSFMEAKKIIGMLDTLKDKQNIEPGATVYWEGATTEEGFFMVQARVTRVVDGMVHVEGHKKYRLTDDGIEEVPAGMQLTSLPMHYFDKTLAERISDSLHFWTDLSDISAVRKAV
jgi:hypothetical protein